METKALKKQMGAAIAMVLVAAVALGSATFAWFVNNTKVTAGKANFSATTAYSLLIADHGQSNWATSLSFEDNNVNFAPISTIGSTNGDFSFFKQNGWGIDAGQNNATTVNKVVALTDEEKTNGAEPLYYEKSFDIKAAQACKLYLDTDTAFANGAGTLNKTLRVALQVSGDNGNKTVIYQVDKEKNAVAANSYNSTLSTLQADGIKKAISGDGAEGAAEAANLVVAVPTDKDIVGGGLLATADASNALSPTLGGAEPLYEFAKANDICTVKVIVWMEGCDYDCTNATVNEITAAANKVTAKFGFCAGL